MSYKIGDKVRIKSTDWYNENKDASGDVLCFHGVHKFTKEMSKFCNKTVTISTNLTGDGEYLIKEDDETNWWTDDMIECKVIQLDVKTKSEKENTDCENCGLTRNSIRCLFMDKCPHNKQKTIIEIPEDWILKDENNDEILTSKIILEKKKKEYPKTYEECYQVTGLSKTSDIYGYKNGLLFEFQKLLIARDAYWKIAGEEMGLGGPWEPDWTNEHQVKYTIYTMGNDVIRHVGNYIHAILAFPTAEMRDAFYENFKELINECKELL